MKCVCQYRTSKAPSQPASQEHPLSKAISKFTVSTRPRQQQNYIKSQTCHDMLRSGCCTCTVSYQHPLVPVPCCLNYLGIWIKEVLLLHNETKRSVRTQLVLSEKRNTSLLDLYLFSLHSRTTVGRISSRRHGPSAPCCYKDMCVCGILRNSQESGSHVWSSRSS